MLAARLLARFARSSAHSLREFALASLASSRTSFARCELRSQLRALRALTNFFCSAKKIFRPSHARLSTPRYPDVGLRRPKSILGLLVPRRPKTDFGRHASILKAAPITHPLCYNSPNTRPSSNNKSKNKFAQGSLRDPLRIYFSLRSPLT